MARNSGPTTRDLGLRGSSAGKGDAPRNTGRAFWDNFPDTLTGNVAGFLPTRRPGVTVKPYRRQAIIRYGHAPHVAQHFQEFS